MIIRRNCNQGELTNIVGAEQDLGNRKTFIVHQQYLVRLSNNIIGMSYPTLSICGKIGENVFLDYRVAFWILSSVGVRYGVYCLKLYKALTGTYRDPYQTSQTRNNTFPLRGS